MANPYRALPSVDRLLGDERLKALVSEFGAATVTDAAREAIEAARRAIAAGETPAPFDSLVAAVAERARATVAVTLRPVINATGIVLHTNLGRAPLSDEAVAAMNAVSRGYSTLEFELEAGERGSRTAHVEALLCRLTGAEAALAVNNNAGAVLLGLSGLASGREVIISRGQLVEIGGGFRIPEIMAESGAVLVEVGTTNRTYLSDYESAVNSDTAAVLRVHTSNFRIVGFAASPSLEELVRLARERRLLLLDDLGSGCLLDTTQFGLGKEPTPQESLISGADLVFFSGDKLLGGPQAGVIAGRGDLVSALKRHPLARALRLDKAALAALQATLLHYVKGEALRKVPVWRMIAMPLADIEERARRWADEVGEPAVVASGRSMIGGGSLPEESLPTALLAIPADGLDLDAIARRLRLSEPPVVARIERDRLLLDPRTVDPRDDGALIAALKSALR
ncbi:MAG: L-seryl-tRNA(Sec) selenium transferase [Dehalococcoidia bacterium]|nr:L-seryl-tRNA(Sec) selenium transferase [Dehalococcoidia bacterium]